jgi:hypothetical protein
LSRECAIGFGSAEPSWQKGFKNFCKNQREFWI